MPKQVVLAVDEESIRREGLRPAPEAWEDGLRADTGRGYFEWWYFDAHLDDGSTAVIVYMTKPLIQRNDPLTPSVQLAITRSDGTKLTGMPLYPAASFGARRDGCDVRIAGNCVHGDLHRYELHAEVAALGTGAPMGADLVFTGIVPPWRPGAGMDYFDEARTRYFAWLPAIPFGTVEGTLTYDGQTRHVQGTGYHDHNWGNVDLNTVFSHWYWGRAHVGDFTTIFVEIVASKEYGYQKLPVFLLAQGDRILTGDGSPLTLETADFQGHPDGKSYPCRLDFRWQKDGSTVTLAVRRPRLIEATSLLTLLPPWKRRLARLVANPYYFRFNGELDLSIDLSGLQAVEHGAELHELMILH